MKMFWQKLRGWRLFRGKAGASAPSAGVEDAASEKAPEVRFARRTKTETCPCTSPAWRATWKSRGSY